MWVLICKGTRWFDDGLSPVSRYDLIPSTRDKISIPFSTPSVQAVQSNMVYPPQEVSMVSTSMAAQRITADR